MYSHTTSPAPAKKLRKPPLPKRATLTALSTEHQNLRTWNATVKRVNHRFVYLRSGPNEVRYSLSTGYAASVDDRLPMDWRLTPKDLRALRRAAGWPKERW